MPQESVASQTTRWVLIAFLLAVGLFVVWQIRSILLLLLTSIVLVVLITTPVRFMTRRGMRRWLATLISLLIIPAFFIILALTILPLLATQFSTLSQLVAKGILQLQAIWDNFNAPPPHYFLGWHYEIIGLRVPRNPLLEAFSQALDSFQFNADIITQVVNSIFNAFGQFSVTVLPFVSGVASFFLNALIVIFMSMYLLTDPKGHEEGMIRLLPLHYRTRGREIVQRLDAAMRGWLESTLLAMIFVAVSTWLGLTVLGLDEALALGVIAGLLAFVPTFGTLIAAVLAVIVGVLQQPQNVGWIIVVTYAISLIQSQVISPLLVAGRIHLPPILVLLGQIIAALFFGFLGVLLAVPLAAILMVLVEEIYVKDVLGDRMEEDATTAENPQQVQPPVDENLVGDRA